MRRSAIALLTAPLLAAALLSGAAPASAEHAAPEHTAPEHTPTQHAAPEHSAPGRAAGNHAASEQAPGTFVDIPSVTVLDTTRSIGVATGGPLHRHSTTLVHVAGVGAIPATGSPTLSLVVSISGAHAFGRLIVWPAGAPRPAAVTVAVRAGQPGSTAALVPVGAGGDIAVANPSDTPVQMTIRAIGYYREGAATDPGSFTPVPAARVYDTNHGSAPPPQSPTYSVPVQLGGLAGIPGRQVVEAVALVLSASRANQAGILTVSSTAPGIFGPGPVASLRYERRSQDSELVIVPVNARGQVFLRQSVYRGIVQVAIDVVGWYRSGTVTDAGGFVLDPGGSGYDIDLAPRQTVGIAVDDSLGVPDGGETDVVDEITAVGYDSIAFAGAGGPLLAAGGVSLYPGGGTRTTPQVVFGAGPGGGSALVTSLLGPGQRLLVHNGSSTRLGVAVRPVGYHLTG